MLLTRHRTASAVLGLALAGSAAAGVAVATAGPASAATAGGPPPGVAYCRSIASLAPGTNLMGACVSYMKSHDHNTAATGVYECQTQLVPQGVFADMGACVSFLNNFKGT